MKYKGTKGFNRHPTYNKTSKSALWFLKQRKTVVTIRALDIKAKLTSKMDYTYRHNQASLKQRML